MAPKNVDGPSATLIKFMKESDFIRSEEWNGYHEFDE
jgi:hypothetical protein